jgi:Flp pilus assembly pilin Flp
VNKLWYEDSGQDVAEYGIILSIVLIIALAVVKLMGQNATAVFTTVAAKVGS